MFKINDLSGSHNDFQEDIFSNRSFYMIAMEI